MEVFGATTEELAEFAKSLGEQGFRGKQLAQWIYKRNVRDFSEMTDLSAGLRKNLEEKATLSRSKIRTRSESGDGTTKYLLELADGRTIESVLLPYEDRVTVCVSTQIGCAADCSFCATAISGFERNLSAGEIVDQVLTLQEDGGRRITNVVFMGMGEPLLNYANTIKAIHLLNHEIGISMRKITVSTVGVIPFIKKLMEEKLQLTLAVSLHAPDDELRRQIMPMARKYDLR
jgi:23S rRNA (adenine2503-C2)-methyltransferase